MFQNSKNEKLFPGNFERFEKRLNFLLHQELHYVHIMFLTKYIYFSLQMPNFDKKLKKISKIFFSGTLMG